MAKETKTEFPSFEDWEAPFDPAADDFDGEKALRLVYNSRKAEHKLKAKIDDKDTTISELETAVNTFKDAQEAAAKEGETETQALERKVEALTKKLAEKPDPKDDLATARLEIALDKGLTKRQAARLVGDDYDALEEDADALIEELGITRENADEWVDEQAGTDENPDAVRERAKIRRRPQGRTAGDPEPNKGPEVDITKPGALDELIPRSR